MRDHSLQTPVLRTAGQAWTGLSVIPLRSPLPAAPAKSRNTVRKDWCSPPWILKTPSCCQGIIRWVWDRKLQRCHPNPWFEFLFQTADTLYQRRISKSPRNPDEWAPGSKDCCLKGIFCILPEIACKTFPLIITVLFMKMKGIGW